MGLNGPISGTYDNDIRIIAGIGYNSMCFDAPYHESKTGNIHTRKSVIYLS